MKNYQVLILHGWYSGSEKWERVKEILEKRGIRVVNPDFPGFKKELDKPWGLADYINWTKEFIEEEKKQGHLTEPFFLLGHSFGGRISISLAARYPDKFKGLILISSAGIRPERNSIPKHLLIFKKLSFLPGYFFFRKLFYKFIIGKTDYIETSGVMKETFKKIIKDDLTYLLPQIETKTLILWGRNDKTTPLANGMAMHRKIKDSKITIMENTGHAPYLENPELLAKNILEFIV